MGKRIALIAGLIAMIAVIMFAVYYLVNAIEQNQGSKNDLSELTADNLITMIGQIYEKTELEAEAFQTNEIAVTDTDMLSYQIGLTSTEGVKSVVMSMPWVNVHPFTLALIQTTKDADIEKIKQDILDNSDPMKWICVGAEKVVVTNSDTVICLIMAKADQIAMIENAFAEITGNTLGAKLEKNGAIID